MANDDNPTGSRAARGLYHVTSRSSARSARSPLAQESIARDLLSEPEDDANDPDSPDGDSDHKSDAGTGEESAYPHSMGRLYRRASFTTAGNRGAMLPSSWGGERQPTRPERHQGRREERSLLRDNNFIPPKHPQRPSTHRSRSFSSAIHHSSVPGVPGIPGGDRRVVSPRDEEAAVAVDGVAEAVRESETTPLLGDPSRSYGGQDDPETLDKRWEEAVAAGRIKTTWQREAKVIGRYSAPLIATFVLQYSLTVASIFVIGHLGTVELGAVSLASMTANITGYAVYQGLATSLDTLCAQAYGSGKKKLVGLQMQRMVWFLFAVTIPIGVVWLCAEPILVRIVPEPDVARLAAQYLRVVLIGAPGYACYESGKRFLQAQGVFSASLYLLIFLAPFNAFMNWLFVWRFKWGYIGAPIAVAVTDNLLPLGLVLYVRFVAGRSCWPGFTKRAFQNWGPMIKLALPGLVMVEAEVLAFEILTLASSYFGTTVLAAQTILGTACTVTWQLPFPVSIAASTRIANLVGATLSDAAKTAAKVSIVAAFGIGLMNFVILAALRDYLPCLFTNDPDVQDLVARVLPLCAAFQLFDALAVNCNGVLRGLGRQEVGGYVQLFSYYVVAMPISFGTAFGLGWQLYGLWSGVAIALAM